MVCDPFGVIEVQVKITETTRPTVDDPATDACDRAVAAENFGGPGKPVGADFNVRIEEGDQIAVRFLDAKVACAASVAAASAADHARACSCRDCTRVIG